MKSIKITAVVLLTVLTLSLAVLVPGQADADSASSLRIGLEEGSELNEEFMDILRDSDADFDRGMAEALLEALISDRFAYVDGTLALGDGSLDLAYRQADDGSRLEAALAADIALSFRARAASDISVIGIETDEEMLDTISSFLAISNPDALKPRSVSIAAGTEYDVTVRAEVRATADISSSVISDGTAPGDAVEMLDTISIRAAGSFSVRMDPVASGTPISLGIGFDLDLAAVLGFNGEYVDMHEVDTAYGDSYVELKRIRASATYSFNGRSTTLEPTGAIGLAPGIRIPNEHGEYRDTASGILGDMELPDLGELIGELDIPGAVVSNDTGVVDGMMEEIAGQLVPRAPAAFYAYAAAMLIAGVAGLIYVAVRRG
jgi:hypothetical protein